MKAWPKSLPRCPRAGRLGMNLGGVRGAKRPGLSSIFQHGIRLKMVKFHRRK